MGRPFQKELEELQESLNWAIKQPIQGLQDYFCVDDKTMIVIGSGGSLTAASCLATLYRERGGSAYVLTPYDFFQSSNLNKNVKVVLVSASGSNKDILMAYEKALKSDIPWLLAVCMKEKNKLQGLVAKNNYGKIIAYTPPTKKDGFLATNSLAVYMVLFLRAFGFFQKTRSSYVDLIFDTFKNEMSNSKNDFFDKDHICVLFGKWGRPVALDIESKCTEAALASVQLSDYRNFAHGRHHWFAKKNNNSYIVAIITKEEEAVAKVTLGALPPDVKIVRVVSRNSGPEATIELLIKSMLFISYLGEVVGIDPGRPGVPEFGRKIYGLSVPKQKNTSPVQAAPQLYQLAVSRKLKYNDLIEIPSSLLEYYNSGLEKYLTRLKKEKFGALVVDYDGTICDSENRFTGPGSETLAALGTLLENEITLGIATGRGQSVRNDLQRLLPNKYWGNILIGYYNCSQIGQGDDGAIPDRNLPLPSYMQSLYEALRCLQGIECLADIEMRPYQISILPKHRKYWRMVRCLVSDLLSKDKFHLFKTLESSHSLDIIHNDISKIKVVDRIKSKLGADCSVLCIGDKGCWPGNDYELLDHEFSLSVDDVSTRADNCYNLSSSGHRGESAFLDYAKACAIHKGFFQLNIKLLEQN